MCELGMNRMRAIALIIFLISGAVLTDVLAFGGLYSKPIWSLIEPEAREFQQAISDFFG